MYIARPPLCSPAGLPSAAEPEPSRPGPPPMALNVQDFGAVGDGKKDNTEAFAATVRS